MGHYDSLQDPTIIGQRVQGQSFQGHQPPNYPMPTTQPYPTKMSDHLVGLIEHSSGIRERVTLQVNKLLGVEPKDGNTPPIPAPTSAREALVTIDQNLQVISYQLSRLEESF